MAAHDLITIDTNELRLAATALRRAAGETVDLGLRIPREPWGAPDWLANPMTDELGLARRQVDELAADLRGQAEQLEGRAAEVDGAETRFWSIANGELRCGCVLPSGVIVATPLSGAASAAWGSGIDGAIIAPVAAGAVGLAAAGGATVMSTAGGAGILGLAGDPDVQIVPGAVSPGPTVLTTSTMGGRNILGLAGDPDVQIVPGSSATIPILMTTTPIGGLGTGIGPEATILRPTGGGELLGTQPGEISIVVPAGSDPRTLLPKLVYDAHGNVVGMQSYGPAMPDPRPIVPLNTNVRQPGGVVPLGTGTGMTVPGTGTYAYPTASGASTTRDYPSNHPYTFPQSR